MENKLIPLGIDAGNGAFKLTGAAGGLEIVSQVATNGTKRILEIQPQAMHERTPLIIGSKDEVQRVLSF